MIFCIQNADYVLYADCRVLSRMGPFFSRGWGVGLEFQVRGLVWQEDTKVNAANAHERSSDKRYDRCDMALAQLKCMARG
jgi:hypothetical protein